MGLSFIHCIRSLKIKYMNRKKQLSSLFSQLCMTLEVNNMNDNHDYNKKGLIMNFNSVYGGYRIDTISGDGGTGEGHFCFSSRFSLGEMISFVQGALHGLDYDIDYNDNYTKATLGTLMSHNNATIKRNAMSIFKTLQK